MSLTPEYAYTGSVRPGDADKWIASIDDISGLGYSPRYSLEDGIVSSANSNIQQGVGLRVVIGEQTGYAFTEDLTLPSMLAAARTASAIASGSRVAAPQAFTPKDMGGLYTTTVPWSDVGIDQKLPVLKYVEEQAKAKDPAVEKVSVYWGDEDERVMIATLDGKLVTDHRPMTRVTVLVTARKGEEVQSGYSNIAAREEFGWYTEERLTTMVKEAVDRTMIQFEARRPPAGEMPVILASGASGILLHEAIGHGMEADFNRKGTSIYSDMIGKKVATNGTARILLQALLDRGLSRTKTEFFRSELVDDDVQRLQELPQRTIVAKDETDPGL